MKIIFSIIFTSIFSITALYSQGKTPPEKPKLVIGIVVEGMRADFLQRYGEQFGEGGFRRLLFGGAQFTNAEYDYLITESSAGYATIASGTNPSQHGIVGDKWFQRLSGNEIYCVSDDKTAMLGTEEKLKGMSPRNLAVNTIGDELKAATFKQSKVISISPKDYGAVLTGGHAADAAVWYDNKTGKWISSNYYYTELPNWVSRFNNKGLSELYCQKQWTLSQDLPRYRSSLSDDSSYENGFEGGNKTFPYNLTALKNTAGNFSILHQTPEGNTLVKDLAVSAIVNEDLGRDNFPDLLMLSFSAGANITPDFGIRSLEHADIYLRLDQDIAKLLEFVTDYVGMENCLIFVTADRGSGDSQEFMKDMKQPTGVFKETAAMSLLRSYMRALYDKGGFIDGFFANQLYLRRTDIEDSKVELKDVQTKVANFLIEFGGVSATVTANDLETRYFGDGMLRRAQNSYYRKRSGDVIIVLEPGFRNENTKNQTSGYREFTHVPLLFYGWKMTHQHVSRKVSVTDIAPTISNFLQIEAPNASTGQALSEIIPVN